MWLQCDLYIILPKWVKKHCYQGATFLPKAETSFDQTRSHWHFFFKIRSPKWWKMKGKAGSQRQPKMMENERKSRVPKAAQNEGKWKEKQGAVGSPKWWKMKGKAGSQRRPKMMENERKSRVPKAAQNDGKWKECEVVVRTNLIGSYQSTGRASWWKKGECSWLPLYPRCFPFVQNLKMTDIPVQNLCSLIVVTVSVARDTSRYKRYNLKAAAFKSLATRSLCTTKMATSCTNQVQCFFSTPARNKFFGPLRIRVAIQQKGKTQLPGAQNIH